jgi:hypothetical protein
MRLETHLPEKPGDRIWSFDALETPVTQSLRRKRHVLQRYKRNRIGGRLAHSFLGHEFIRCKQN